MVQRFVNGGFEVVQGMDTTDSNPKTWLPADLCDFVQERSIIGCGRIKKVPPTITSISYQKAGTKMACPSPWPGFVTMTSMKNKPVVS
jgi:hypothetical protein